MKNLIIDGQVLQSDAWHRGMGKYTFQILQQLDKKVSKELDISIIFNNSIECEKIRFETIKYLCPQIKQIHISLPLTSDKNVNSEIYKKKLNLLIKNTYKYGQNYFLLTSLFQFDFFAEFPRNCCNLLLFYDLIPLLFWSDLGGYFPPHLYMRRFLRLLEADHIFTISDTTRNDLLKTFGLKSEIISNINGGFTKFSEIIKKPINFNVPSEFILFPTGNLPHKNNEIAIKGFNEYFEKSKKAIPLLITSHFDDLQKNKLLSLSSNIIFTNQVTDQEMEWLYQNAKAILFSSKYEGLGMPILDAVANNKPVIASRISAFKEMSQNAFYYFDPNDYIDLSKKINESINTTNFSKKLQYYPLINRKYTWTNSVQTIINFLNKTNWKSHKNFIKKTSKSHIAIISQHPGIGDHLGRISEKLYFSLNNQYSIDYYFDSTGYYYREMERPTFLNYFDCNIFDIQKLTLRSYKKYDHIIYIIDNNALPSRLALNASVMPGIILDGCNKANLDDQKRMLLDIVLDNQLVVFRVNNNTNIDYQNLIIKLKKQLSKSHKHYNKSEEIIRHGYLNRSIIHKLMGLK